MLRISIPKADVNPDCRVYGYQIAVAGDDRVAMLKKNVYARGYCMGVGHEPDGGVTTLEIPTAELPAGKKLTIAVRPCSSLGTKGKAIGTTFRVKMLPIPLLRPACEKCILPTRHLGEQL